MTTHKKQRRPANDTRPASAHRMSCVVVPASPWISKKRAVGAVLLAFASMLAVALVGSFVLPHPQAARVPASVATAPDLFDITLSANELAPSDSEAALVAEKLPASATHPQKQKTNKAMPPVLQVTVEPTENAEDQDDEDRAERKAAEAQAALRKHNLKQAIVLQHAAVELDPENQLYRLNLAIMHDHAGDAAGAVSLYRQVLDAHQAHDETLPEKMDADAIRGRMDYLAATASR